MEATALWALLASQIHTVLPPAGPLYDFEVDPSAVFGHDGFVLDGSGVVDFKELQPFMATGATGNTSSDPGQALSLDPDEELYELARAARPRGPPRQLPTPLLAPPRAGVAALRARAA